MIDGLDDLLAGKGQPGLQELRALVLELLGGPDVSGRLIDEQRLRRSRVYRLRFEVNGDVRSVVAKRFTLQRARREQLVVRRWLPAVGMSQNGPPLLGTTAERTTGQHIWHVYEDLGNWTLDKGDPDDGRVRAAVESIAQIHTRFAGHAVLGECRASGYDLGIRFFTSCVRDAIRSLEALCSPGVGLSANQQALRDRLLYRLHKLLDEQPHRAQAMAEHGGPDTLLHGDLWTKNVLVLPTANGLKVRLIDWDHAGVGPISYDLSTFLFRFPIHDRRWILACYQEAVRQLDWCLPGPSDLNLLFDTAECARLASNINWLATAASEGQAEWAFDDLAWIDQWFDMLEPVLPVRRVKRSH